NHSPKGSGRRPGGPEGPSRRLERSRKLRSEPKARSKHLLAFRARISIISSWVFTQHKRPLLKNFAKKTSKNYAQLAAFRAILGFSLSISVRYSKILQKNPKKIRSRVGIYYGGGGTCPNETEVPQGF